jgi:hypothetical protein
LKETQSILVLKYILPQHEHKEVLWWGLSLVLQNIGIMLSASVLWLAQNIDEEYE